MKKVIFPLVVFSICLSSVAIAVAQDSANHPAPDTSAFKWPSFIGGDLFLGGELYGLHLSGVGSLTAGTAIGAELRIHPLFVGATAGFCGDEGIPYIHTFDKQVHQGTFSFYSLYAGVIIGTYRADIGEIYGDNSAWTTHTPDVNYTVGYLGISKRWCDIIFVEPEVKVMFPIVAHYSLVQNYIEFTPVTQHYHLRDLFFAIGVKVGIGFN